MPGLEFFVIVTCVGCLLLGFSGMVGWRVWQSRGLAELQWSPAKRSELRLAMEFSLFSMIFALLPFPMVYQWGDGFMVWRVPSMAIGLFLLVQVLRTQRLARRYGMNWPSATLSLLVISAILLTIEAINALFWNSFAVYTWALLWVLILASVQFTAFVLYERNERNERQLKPTDSQVVKSLGPQPYNVARSIGLHRTIDPDSRVHGNVRSAGEQLRRDRRPYRPDSEADYHTNVHRDPVSYARRQRYIHRFPNGDDRSNGRNPN